MEKKLIKNTKCYISVFCVTFAGENRRVLFKELANKKITINKSVYKCKGFEFRFLSEEDQRFIQISLYVENPNISILLRDENVDYGIRCGIEFDSLNIAESPGGFAGVLCDYVFMFSNKPISKNRILQYFDLNEKQPALPYNEYYNFRRLMKHQRRITDFLEMMHYFDTDATLAGMTKSLIENTRFCGENFISDKTPIKEGKVLFEENLTLLSARQYALAGDRKVAVLNFANPLKAGGGILRGANAQEESLCRQSNLYKSLTAANAGNFYQCHNEIQGKNQYTSIFVGTDSVIYSPKVTVVKNNKVFAPDFRIEDEEVYCDEIYQIDVITCAAPFFSGSDYMIPNGDLEHIFKRRIKNIFEAAIEYDVDILVLGAFGCGEFHNPPEIVASAFREVLMEERYLKAFETVIFAVKRSDIVCPNIEAFETYFSTYPDLNKSGKEKRHRELYKWVCACRKENAWDSVHCNKCGMQRKHALSVNFYD